MIHHKSARRVPWCSGGRKVNGLKIFKGCYRHIDETRNMAKREQPLENQKMQSAVSVKLL